MYRDSINHGFKYRDLRNKMLQIVIDNLEALKLDYSRFEVEKNYFNSELISITLICSFPNKVGELTIWNDLSRVKEWIDPLGLAAEGTLGTYGKLKGRGNQAHEFIRNKMLELMGETPQVND
jgi:rhs-related protein